MPPLLEGRAITVRFGGLTAVKGVDFAVAANEVLSVIGPNGAGKTTLFNAITGRVRPSEGQILLRGQAIQRLAPHAIAKRGIVRTFQKTEVFGPLTVVQGVQAANGDLYSFRDRLPAVLQVGDVAAGVRRRAAADLAKRIGQTSQGQAQPLPEPA